MAYIKNNWVDREGTTRYFETVDDDGALIFTPDYTQVTELGTPVNADNMNHIEEGIAAGSFTKFDLNTTYGKDDLVTAIEESSPVIYKSLQDNNIGNALTDLAYWEKISLGGGGGLEIGDIGIAPLGIDETKGKRRYLNGQLIIQDQYAQFTAKVKSAIELYPSLSITEDEWQTLSTMTVGGQVGRFVVDDEAGTIRLPKIIMPIQGLTDLSKLGQIVAAGLPTHTHTRGSMNITGNIYGLEQGSADGAFTSSDWKLVANDGADQQLRKAAFNASKTWTGSTSEPNNATYGKSNTVQQQQIQYPYFIQVATGAETEDNIINEIELNNPFFLGMSQYFETAPNNSSWLKSEGQWNAKAVYPTVYDWALINANNSIEGFKLVTDTYTDYDYVINTADETFRLPLLNGSEFKSGVKSADIPLQQNGNTYIAPANGWFVVEGVASGSSAYVDLVGSVSSSSHCQTSGHYLKSYVPVSRGSSCILYYTDLSQISLRFIYARGNGSLYFYVGETVQNANLVNIGRIQETYATKSMVDGQWVNKALVLASNVACPNSDLSLDLSSWLPNDGYIYEILCDAAGSTGSTSGNRAGIAVTSDILLDNGFNVVTAQTRSASTVSFASSFTIPIGTARYLKLVNGVGTNTGTFTLTARAYRRLGTNL